MNKIGHIVSKLCLLSVLAFGAVLVSGCNYEDNPSLTGKTMGTSYHIQIAERVSKKKLDELLPLIEGELERVNREMSTWDPNSEISIFNKSSSMEPVEVSTPFAEVVERALKFSKESDGAFDPTLQPLLRLWGFVGESDQRTIPSEEEIEATKALTGWHKISVPSPSSLQKSESAVSLDLGAIAKGYGVDAIGQILTEHGLENWFVEIGGEVVVHGTNPNGNPWRIGIQYPSPNPADDQLHAVLHLSGGAVATSGDYRNYIMDGEQIYSHILDPRTGRSVYSQTASVTVYALNCTDADAMATGLFVMGAEEGLEWVERTPHVEALFLLRSEDGSIIEKNSSGFLSITGYSH